jgi:ATP-dependent Clp protease protease subunit
MKPEEITAILQRRTKDCEIVVPDTIFSNKNTEDNKESSFLSTLSIKGDINQDLLADFQKGVDICLRKCEETGQKIIPVEICSVGGEIYPTLGIIDSFQAIKNAGIEVLTHVHGFAFSAAACLALLGTKGMRFMSPSATLMIHDSSSGHYGKTSETESDLFEVKRLRKLLFTLMEENCDFPKGFFMKELDKKKNVDWYLSAKEAKKQKFIDEVGVPRITYKIKNELSFVFSLY